MRISDWSSDVCSSDLAKGAVHGNGRLAAPRAHLAGEDNQHCDDHPCPPAMDEVRQKGIVEERMEEAARPVDAFGEEAALHQWPGIRVEPPGAGYIARA